VDKHKENNFLIEAIEELYADIGKISGYTKEEADALCLYILMTQEIFDKCLKTAAETRDFETEDYLYKTFPDFLKTENSG